MADLGATLRTSSVPPRERTTAGAVRPRTRAVGAPRPSILIAVFILSLAIPISFYVGPVRLSPYRVALIMLLPPALAALFGGALGRVRPTDILMIAFALWGSISLFLTTDFGAAMQPSGISFIESLGAYLAGRFLVRDLRSFDYMARFACLMLAVLLPFALIETLTGNAILLNLLSQITRQDYFVMQGTRMGLHRASVVFEHPILYGAFASSALGIALYGSRKRQVAAFGRLAPAVVTVAALCSVSSGAIAALVAQGMLAAWDRLTKRISRRWMILSGCFVAIYAVIDFLSTRDPIQVMASYLTFSPHTAYYRILIWEYGSADAMRHPLFGIGLADWVRPSWMPPSIDNFWLVVALRHGLPSVIFLILAIVFLFGQAGRRKLVSSDLSSTRAGILITLGGVIVAACTVDYWNAMYCWFMFLIGSAVWLIGAEDSDVGKEEAPRLNRTKRPSLASRGSEQPGRIRLGRASRHGLQPEQRRHSVLHGMTAAPP